MKAKMGRPKTIVGRLTTCAFVLTNRQSRWVSARAKACGVSRSEIMRALVQVGITAAELDQPVKVAT